MEIYKYNNNSFSIKDLGEDLNLNGYKWNFIFDFINLNTDHYYFLGEKIEIYKPEIILLIKELSEEVYINQEYNKVFIKIKTANVILNRFQLSKLWSYYEFPTIIFLKNQSQIVDLIKLVTQNSTYEAITGSIDSILLIHRNFERNVLWIKKSQDMPLLFE